MKALLAAMTMAAAQGCAAGAHWHGPILVHDRTEEPVVRRGKEVVSLYDLEKEPAVPKEAKEILSRSFHGDGCRSVASKIEGSFTGRGRKQTMFSVKNGCGMASGTSVVYEGGREVWRSENEAVAVRAVDVDGDGQDEWVEVESSCKYDCSSEAWLVGVQYGMSQTLLDVQEAQVSHCEGKEGKIVWKHVVAREDGVQTEIRERGCRP